MLKLLLSNKKAIISILTVLGGFTALIQFHNSQVDSYKDSIIAQVKTELQQQHNEQYDKLIKKRDRELALKVREYELKLRSAEDAKDKYWKGYYDKKEQALIAQFKTEREGQEIKDEADKISNSHTITGNTVRLLNKARNIVNAKANSND